MKIKLILSLLIGLFLCSAPSFVQAASSSASSNVSIEKMDKATKKAMKKELKEALKAEKKAQPGEKKGVGGAILVILAFFVPPLAVFFKVGIGSQFWINLLLTLLLFVPGIIHALIVITG